MVVINKSGGAGGEGFLDVKGQGRSGQDHHHPVEPVHHAPGDRHSLQLEDLTPVAMLALDEFVLWVTADTPYKTAKEYIDAVKKRRHKFKMGGTGSKQEDQIITVGIEKATGVKLNYIPFKGGGEVAVQLVGKHIDSTVNNPIEAVAQWRARKCGRCACSTASASRSTKDHRHMSWNDIPTCKDGLDVDYLMLRGIFMPGRPPERSPTTSTCSRRCARRPSGRT